MNEERSVRSFVFDWALVIIVSAISLACIRFPPDSHYFSLLDLSISHAHREQVKVPLWLFVLLTVVAPILIITTVSFRQSRVRAHTLNNGLLGLGISLGTATVVLNIKNLAGKPRPDFLDICQPDLSTIEAHTVGGFGQGLSPLWAMVERGICQQGDQALLNDAFRSFPSGYATGKAAAKGIRLSIDISQSRLLASGIFHSGFVSNSAFILLCQLLDRNHSRLEKAQSH